MMQRVAATDLQLVKSQQVFKMSTTVLMDTLNRLVKLGMDLPKGSCGKSFQND